MQLGDAQITAITSFNDFLSAPLPPKTQERLLRFPLGEQDSVLLPLNQITEILSVDLGEVLLIPEMPRCVLGICNWRGEMLWLIDLNDFVGYSSLLQQEQLSSFTVIVIQSNQQAVGLAVPQVNEIELHDLQPLQPPPIGLFSPELLPLVQGILSGSSDAVLDLQSLIHCPLWKKHLKEKA